MCLIRLGKKNAVHGKGQDKGSQDENPNAAPPVSLFKGPAAIGIGIVNNCKRRE